ncbi:hypothetical protein TRFO_10353 [Tritrichomonas foetus]|uniref:Uncharacterized protein n=1 Tax=Tritrichomonas foetus TaxID=1144522 RepID=A0A1J4JBT7_9EUKA|nr:hypothetical protein TRFO_10353 [Tritrichomonas foetus]|eukprot:OHS95711.1 hypothetical protein TRFO_10353 [Tritrichomonas foetus]
MLDDLGIPLPSQRNKGTTKKRRRPPQNRKVHMDFDLDDLDNLNLDDLGLNDPINDNTKKKDDDDFFKNIFNLDSDLEPDQDPETTEILVESGSPQIKNDDKTIQFSQSHQSKSLQSKSFNSNSSKTRFETSILNYLDILLADLSASFRSTLIELAESAFLYDDLISDFMIDLSNEIHDIFETEKYEFYPFDIEEILNDTNSFFSELTLPNSNSEIENENKPIRAIEVESRKLSFLDSSTELLNSIRIERAEVFSYRSGNSHFYDINNSLQYKILDFEEKKVLLEEEKDKIDMQLQKLSKKRDKLFQNNDLENDENIMKSILENKESLIQDIKNYKPDRFSQNLSSFSHMMAMEVTQCRIMNEQLMTLIDQFYYLKFPSNFQLSIPSSPTTNVLSNSRSNSPTRSPTRSPTVFIEQMKGRLRELNDKREEAKNSIDNFM